MASNILSRLLPSATGEPSIYETLRQYEDTSDRSDLDEEAVTAIDEENLGAAFRDEDIDVEAMGGLSQRENGLTDSALPVRSTQHRYERPGAAGTSHFAKEADEVDNEVPQSLLIEDETTLARKPPKNRRIRLPHSVPGPSTHATEAKWQATQRGQQLHPERSPPSLQRKPNVFKGRPLTLLDPKEQAAWMWANVDNLDHFLHNVYEYYAGHGMWSILLNRLVKLLTLAFIVAFTTFLTYCIDYNKVPNSKSMSQIVIPQCTNNMSGTTNVLLWLFAFFWVFKVFDYCRDIRRLRSMQVFYRYLLEIPDSDMQTISWQEVVKKLMNLRELNPVTADGTKEQHRRFMGSQSKQRMDAHDIANRLMRRDNYLIAIINKDVLDFTLPLPFIRNRQLFSRTLEWNLQYCILDFVFNEQGQVRSLFLRDSHRKELSDGFRSRFLFAGFVSLVCAPFAVLYYMLFYFFRYFTEYQRNPSQIGSRQYTPFALWKFREFNELQHLFGRRINMSYPFASRYIDQFPKDKTIQVSGFIAFVAGALASVLAVASLVDPESFLAFELTPERTVLFYLGVFGSVWAVARGNVPEENLVFDPEYALSNVTEYTHYMPRHWKGRLHTNEVRVEFAQLYRMKLFIFLEEILSIILAPYLLWFTLPKCSDRLVDFFREFTIHVDGMGYLCSFAVFDFKKGAGLTPQMDHTAAHGLREEYYATKDGKMLASYYGFIDNYVTNQRSGAPFLHPASKSSFHAPPAFPGLASPSFTGEGNASAQNLSHQDRQRSYHNPALVGIGAATRPGPRRTSRFALQGNHASPLASMLLDPHHQPSAATLKKNRNIGSFTRLRGSRAPLSQPIKDDEEGSLETPPRSAQKESEEAIEESNLDDSWKMTKAGNREEDDGEDNDEKTGDKAPGVLGLAYQFSKAQTEGRPGVNI